MPEQSSLQPLNLRRRVSLFAARTETVFPDVFSDDLPASRSREDQVDNHVLGKFTGGLKNVFFMSRALSLASYRNAPSRISRNDPLVALVALGAASPLAV